MSLTEDCMRWCDRWYDPDRGLLWNPEGSYDELSGPRTLHLVPQSGWYGAGLMLRDDVERAATVFDQLCDLQYDEPGTIWHGTFARFAEAPHPEPGAIEWVDYDPNWRQFVGTTFSMVLRRFGDDALPASTAGRMHAAIDLAIAGDPPDRVAPSYTNIALMRSWLEFEHGDAGTRAAAESYAGAVVALFDEHGAFEEYNSPTYYGIDLYALALWARHSSSPVLTEHGARIEGAVWDDIARWWHAGLHNLCGPWSRAYGMDMTSYAALLGLWIGEADPKAFPSLDRPFDHSHDTTLAPMIDLVGTGMTAAARSAIASFDGTHDVVQRITDDRVATGWLGDEIMFGGESGGPFPARGQYHPATAHWRDGWLRVRHEREVDAVAAGGVLTVTPRASGTATLIVHGDPEGAISAEVDGASIDLAPDVKVKLTDPTSIIVRTGGEQG
jgi:subtilisin family serine protease